MPVQVIYKNGKKYYRWGREGKVYDNQRDAETQGRAIEASKHSKPKQTGR